MSQGSAVTNPATNEVVESFDTFTNEQIQEALAKSHEAFQTWRKTPIEERAKIVSRAAELFKERKADLAKIFLTSPACTEVGEKIALSRRIDKHWRLVGWGTVRRGTTLEPESN